jgi:hypothetical protein
MPSDSASLQVRSGAVVGDANGFPLMVFIRTSRIARRWMPQPTRPATTKISALNIRGPGLASVRRTAGKKRLISTIKTATWVTNPPAPIACLRGIIRSKSAYSMPTNGVWAPLSYGRLFQISLKVPLANRARPVFGNGADAVHFYHDSRRPRPLKSIQPPFGGLLENRED